VLIKVKLKFSVCTSRKHRSGREVQLHSFLTRALDGGDWSSWHPGRFILGKKKTASDSHWVGAWIISRADLDHLEKCFPRLLSPYPSDCTYWRIAVPPTCVVSYCSPGFTTFTAACCVCCYRDQTTSSVTGMLFFFSGIRARDFCWKLATSQPPTFLISSAGSGTKQSTELTLPDFWWKD
jgi:hypothetical protein